MIGYAKLLLEATRQPAEAPSLARAEISEEMVERVATAIRNRCSSEDTEWQYYIPEAKAAIDAFRTFQSIATITEKE
jgi:hypothetical protein